MYIIKLKYTNRDELLYANSSVMETVKFIKSNYDLKWFSLSSYSDAVKLFNRLIDRNSYREEVVWGMPADPLEFISIVELSHYAPYGEYKVLDYREFRYE